MATWMKAAVTLVSLLPLCFGIFPTLAPPQQQPLVPSCLAQLEKDCGSPLPPPAACFACIGRKGVPPACKTARHAQRICNG
eukprot:COSAG01_NODE_29744_length_630_cov_2.056497_1_plen_80_part_10